MTRVRSSAIGLVAVAAAVAMPAAVCQAAVVSMGELSPATPWILPGQSGGAGLLFGYTPQGEGLTYLAGPGEQNDVSFEEIEVGMEPTLMPGQAPPPEDRSDGFLVRDPGAIVIARSGCRQVSLHEAMCWLTGGSWDFTAVYLGDRADRAGHAPGHELVLQGGAGDDVIDEGGVGETFAFGDGGDDRLSGWWVHGGEGDDFLKGAGLTGADHQPRHGPNNPLVWWEYNLFGGGGSDTIIAGPGTNNIAGDPGGFEVGLPPHLLRGSLLPGDDTIVGGPMAWDRIWAGPGDDHVTSTDGLLDDVTCDEGRDSWVADAIDVDKSPHPETDVSCEEITVPS